MIDQPFNTINVHRAGNAEVMAAENRPLCLYVDATVTILMFFIVI